MAGVMGAFTGLRKCPMQAKWGSRVIKVTVIKLLTTPDKALKNVAKFSLFCLFLIE